MTHRHKSTARSIARTLGCLLLAGGAAASAQRAFPPTLDDPYYRLAVPNSGAYYDPAKPGVSMIVDMRPDGSAFIVLGTYDEAGMPTWYTIQEQFQPTYGYASPSNFSPLYSPPDIGHIVAPVYWATGGGCIGCTPGSPLVVPAGVRGAPGPASAKVTWTSSTHATVVLGEQQWSMVTLALDGPLAQRVAGEWDLQVIGLTDERVNQTAHSRVLLREVPMPNIELQFLDHDVTPALPDATHWFRVNCMSTCGQDGAGDFWKGEYRVATTAPDYVATYLWVNEMSGKAGIEQYKAPPHIPQCASCDIFKNWDVIDETLSASPFRYRFEVFLSSDHIKGRRSSGTLDSSAAILSMDRLLKTQGF